MEVSRLMKYVDGGYSILSWAAGVGNEEIVKLLLKSGAHTAIGDDCIEWCAKIIQVAFRHSRVTEQSK
jgi:ankyrin repeat protein